MTDLIGHKVLDDISEMNSSELIMNAIEVGIKRLTNTGPDITMSDAFEIFKLDEMLTAEKIPHKLFEWNSCDGYQITYASDGEWFLRKPGCGDVVLNRDSYGHEQGLLEAMGFDITEEEYGDEVVGYLTAEEAFQFFKRQYEKDQKGEK